MGRSEKNLRYVLSFLITFFTYIPLAHAADLALEINNASFTEKVGNGNGLYEPGETVEIAVSLKALNQNALNTFATLASPDSSITIQQNSVSYGNIVAGAVGNSSSALKFTVSSACPVGKIVSLPLMLSASGYSRAVEIRMIPGTSYLAVGAPMSLAAGSQSYWGPIEIDRSNGEQAAGDGRTLTINGKTYARGFGVHALAQLNSVIPSDAARFTASFGIDDEVKNAGVGSVKVSVKLNGTEKWSAVVTGSNDAVVCDIPVTPGQVFAIVLDPNGAAAYDHTDIVYPSFIAKQAAASSGSNGVAMALTSSTNGWGPVEADKSNGEQPAGDGRTMTVNGLIFARGFGAHASAQSPMTQLNAVAPANATNFTANFGIDDEVKTCSGASVKASIKVAGIEKWSGVIVGGSDPILSNNVAVAPGQQVAIVIDPNGAATCDHVDIGYPWFVTVNPVAFTMTVDVVDQQHLRFNPVGIPSGATKVTFESISTVGREVGPKVGPNPDVNLPASWPQTFDLYHPGWQIDVRAVAKDNAGVVLAATPYKTIPMPGDSTISPWPPSSPPVSVPSPFTMSVTRVDEQTLQFNPVGIPSGATKVTFTSISTSGRETGPKVGPTSPNTDVSLPATWPKTFSGYHPGWLIDIQGLAKDANNNTIASTPVVTVEMLRPDLSAIPWPPTTGIPAMINPATGSMLTSSTVTFQWSTVTGVLEHALTVARSQAALDSGSGTLFNGSTGMNLSQSVGGINIDGNSLYARLKWRTSTGWQSTDYTYATQAFTTLGIPPAMTPMGCPSNGIQVGLGSASTIESAMNNAPAGATLCLASGTYNMDHEVYLRDGLTYLGKPGQTVVVNGGVQSLQGGTVLKGASSGTHIFHIRGDNVRIEGIGFEGKPIMLDKDGCNRNANIIINFNVFLLKGTGSNNNGITFTCGLSGTVMNGVQQRSQITNNYFTGYGGGFGAYGYNYDHLTIANNEFVNVDAGMHIDGQHAGGETLVEQNFITGAKGMGMEFQTYCTNCVFQDNWYEHPVLSSKPPTDDNHDGDSDDPGENPNGNSMAYSLILDRGVNITIRRNIEMSVIPQERPDGIGVRVGIEAGGDNSLVEDNYMNGVNATVAVNDCSDSASVTVRNNRFLNARQGVGTNGCFSQNSARTLTQSNNSSTQPLSATMETRISTQRKPGIGAKRF